MIYDYENKTLQVKVVYYGPAMSGKTTSIKYLFSYFNKEKELNSIDSTIGRTLFFDFGVLKFKGNNWGLKLLIYSATGQDFYASTRPATLNGVDGIIFVLDSRKIYLDHNIRSWNELKTLFGNEFYNIPLVISMNKSDIDNMEIISRQDFIDRIEYSRFRSVCINRTIAVKGDGILNSFKDLIGFIFPNLTINANLTN